MLRAFALHTCFAALSIAALTASPAAAQEWAMKMFDSTEHDFGTVARGSDTVYRFEIENIYKEDVHIASVRSSCGCTTPSIENNTIKTWEKAYVVAKFNTRTYTGVHSATLTVTIDKPFYAQVQVRVHGDIRGDVVFEPGKIDFGAVDQGTPAEKSVGVTYAGYQQWRIQDVRSASDSLEVELVEQPKYSNQTKYNLIVRLKPSAPPGLLNEQLVIVTNDGRNPRIPLDVQGKVVPEISVAPANLVLGKVTTDAPVTKRIIVRGKKPFRVTNVSCDEQGFGFDVKDQSSDRHIITVTFRPTRAGEMKAPIRIETDLGAEYVAECMAYGTLASPDPPASAPEIPASAPEMNDASETAAGESTGAEAAGSNSERVARD